MFGVICGIIIFIVLIFVIIAILGTNKNTKKIAEAQSQTSSEKPQHDRYCPKCGRSIPFDAVICPYCKKEFED